MENQQYMITAGDVFHVILKRIWIVVIITLACALALFCVVQFYYNSSRQSYVAKCYISFPGLKSENAQSLYPDGTVFRIKDLVSYDVLNEIKQDAGGKFNSVDVLAMTENGGITITQSDLSSSQAESGADLAVTLTVSAAYFSDSKQAQNFIAAVASYPVMHA